jgi:hypothetical protein
MAQDGCVQRRNCTNRGGRELPIHTLFVSLKVGPAMTYLESILGFGGSVLCRSYARLHSFPNTANKLKDFQDPVCHVSNSRLLFQRQASNPNVFGIGCDACPTLGLASLSTWWQCSLISFAVDASKEKQQIYEIQPLPGTEK